MSHMACRTAWLGQCQEVLAAEDLWDAAADSSPATAAGVKRLLSVLAGVEAALVDATDSWVELLVAELLHLYPNLKPQVSVALNIGPRSAACPSAHTTRCCSALLLCRLRPEVVTFDWAICQILKFLR